MLSSYIMYLFYCDETNLEKKDNDFFVYGGLALEGQAAYSLSLEVDNIRRLANIPADARLKFNPKPPQLSHQKFISVKQDLIEATISHGGKFFTSLILHNIATSSDDARRNEINRICYHYDCYLRRLKSHGLVLIDRFEDKDKKIDAHLREKFSIGITGPDLPYSQEIRLNQIIGFHYAAVGQSHFSSIIDIILGSFRFAINSYTRQERRKVGTAGRILEKLSPLFFREDATQNVSEISLFFSPKFVKRAEYRLHYENLSLFFSEHGIIPEQKIIDELDIR